MPLCLQVVIDRESGRSKGYGFVKFDDTRDATDAIASCHGKVRYCQSEPHVLAAVKPQMTCKQVVQLLDALQAQHQE